MQQIAVGAVQLDRIDARPHGAPGSLNEGLAYALHVVRRHLARERPIRTERNGGWSNRLPGVARPIERPAAFPRTLRRGFAPGMRQLDAELRIAVAPAVRGDARERRFAVVRIEPEAAMGDAPAALDAGRLHHEQRRPRIAQRAEVIEMPVGRGAVIGAVLAHGRDDDPVAELERIKPDR